MANPPYQRVQFEGHTFNRRTVQFIQQVRIIFTLIGGTGGIRLLQGSYNGGKGKVAVSGGTHDGGGAIDWEPTKPTPKNWMMLQKAERICGGAGWDRPTLPGYWEHHDHCIVIGDKEMSPAAMSQVQDYHADLNGLANHGHDRSWKPSVIPVFSYPLGIVDLTNVRKEAVKTKGWKVHGGVKAIQRALNAKTGTHLVVDGLFGKTTKRAYSRYEKQIGGDGDGAPGTFSLTLLGAARFNVKP